MIRPQDGLVIVDILSEGQQGLRQGQVKSGTPQIMSGIGSPDVHWTRCQVRPCVGCRRTRCERSSLVLEHAATQRSLLRSTSSLSFFLYSVTGADHTLTVLLAMLTVWLPFSGQPWSIAVLCERTSEGVCPDASKGCCSCSLYSPFVSFLLFYSSYVPSLRVSLLAGSAVFNGAAGGPWQGKCNGLHSRILCAPENDHLSPQLASFTTARYLWWRSTSSVRILGHFSDVRENTDHQINLQSSKPWADSLRILNP